MLYLGRQHGVFPVGKEYFFAHAIIPGRRETTVAGFFTKHGSDTLAIFWKDDQRDAEAEVLEVEASAKEIGLHAVLKEEIFDLLLDIRSTLAGIVLQPWP